MLYKCFWWSFFSLFVLGLLKYLAQIIIFALLNHAYVTMLNTLILITPCSHLNKFGQFLSDYLNVPVYEN